MRKKRLFSLLLALVLCTSAMCMSAQASSTVWDGRTSQKFSGGSGSETDPYQIANGAELYYLALQSDTSFYYVLTDNIDLGNHLFPTIPSFSGVLDGDGFQIGGLHVEITEKDSESVAGLIGKCLGTVKNLTVSGSVSNVYGAAGGVVGLLLSSDGIVENCVNYCTVTTEKSNSSAGGLVGYSKWAGKVIDSKNYGDVQGYNAGGIIGKAYDTHNNSNDPITPRVVGCLNAGSIASPSSYAGGICGRLEGYKIAQSYNMGTVTAASAGGGIIGYGSGTHNYVNGKHTFIFSSIENCFNTGTVTAKTAGGIAGSFTCYETKYGQVDLCYNVGKLTASEDGKTGEILGLGERPDNVSFVLAKVSNCLYLNTQNPNATYRQGTGYSAAALQGVGAYASFDFNSIWGWDTSGNYPYAILNRAGLPQNSCQHNYQLTSTTATCLSDGIAVYTCTNCGKKKTEAAPAKGHEWAEATCTAPKTCKVCNATEGTAKGHDWADATCTAPKTCKVCNATEGTAKGHDWTEATCTTPKTCKVCNATEGTAKGHDWADATCTAPKTCKVCNATEGTAKGHDWTDATCTAPKTCKVCHVTEGTAKGHDWTDATCTTPKTCKVCNATEGTANGHSWAEATCTAPKTCKVCHVTEGKPNGHTLAAAVRENVKPATCTAAGSYDEVVYCSVCQAEISRTQKTIAKIAHDFSNNRAECANGCGTKNPNYVAPPYNPPSPPSPTPTEPEKPENPFVDVKEGDLVYDPVIWAVGKGITSGTTATTFSPDGICTRAEIVTFLWRTSGKPEPAGESNPFSDVTESNYFYKAVLWAVEKGITKGTTASTFSPYDTCTRGQAVTFLYRYAGLPAVANGTHPFSDVTASHYFHDAVIWAVSKAITNGTSAATFSPNDFCTRGQIVTFLYRYLGK